MSQDNVSRYQIVDEIGRGGMATVYRAFDPMFKRDVAVKIMAGELLQDPLLRARFEREAQTIAALEHPAIVPVYDFGEDDGRLYLVMRYMNGGTLAEKLSPGSMSIAETTTILTRIGGALERAHQKGIIHRDLKPSNILFDSYNDAFLADFGIARLTESSVTLTGQAVIGTPAYMSPEQIHGDKQIDGRSDIYALGVICFEMLTGQRPYTDDTPTKVMMKHVIDPVPDIRQFNPDLPAGVDAVIARTMAKEPDDRFSSAVEMTTELSAAVIPAAPTVSPQAAAAMASASKHDDVTEVAGPDDAVAPFPESPEDTLSRDTTEIAEVGMPAAPPAAATPAPETEMATPEFATDESPQTEITPPAFVTKPSPETEIAVADLSTKPVDQSEDGTPAPAAVQSGPVKRNSRIPILAGVGVAMIIFIVIAAVAIVFLTQGDGDDEEELAELPVPTGQISEAVTAATSEPASEIVAIENTPEVETPGAVDRIDEATSHLDEIYALIDDGDFELALDEVNQAIALAPDEQWFYHERAYVFWLLEEYEASIVEMDIAVELEPNAENYGRRGEIRRDAEDLEGAIEDFQVAIELDPENATRYRELGRTFRMIGELNIALENYNIAHELRPDGAWIVGIRGEIHRDLGNVEQAARDALLAYELDPEEIAHVDRLASILAWDLEDWERGLEAYSRAIDLDPNEAWRFTERAIIQRILGDGEAALSDHDRAIELEADDLWHTIEKGNTYRDLFNDIDNALETYALAMEMEPASPDPYVERAYLYVDLLGDLGAGLADLDRAIEKDPEAGWLYSERATLHQELGDLEAALADYLRYMEMEDSDSWAYIDLGYFYFDVLDDADAALENWNIAVELDPDNPEVYHARSLYYADTVQDYDQAFAELGMCLEIDPESEWCYWDRAWLHDSLGDYQLAVEDMRRYLETSSFDDCPDCVQEAEEYIEINS